MDKFFVGADLDKAVRIAKRASKLYHTTVYLDEDFGVDENDPWGFFVTTETSNNVYAKYTNGISA